MKPAIRTQVDERQMEFSYAAATDTSDLPDLARQEFREEADANALLKRFGLNVPVQAQPTFGEIDFDLDLHTAHIARDRVAHALRRLPPELREKYSTSEKLLDGMNSGELGVDLRNARDEREKKEATARAKRERAASKAAQDDDPPPPKPEPSPAPPKPATGA